MKKEEMKTEDVQTFAALGPEDTKKKQYRGKILYICLDHMQKDNRMQLQ